MPKGFEGSLDENTAVLENLACSRLSVCGERAKKRASAEKTSQALGLWGKSEKAGERGKDEPGSRFVGKERKSGRARKRRARLSVCGERAKKRASTEKTSGDEGERRKESL